MNELELVFEIPDHPTTGHKRKVEMVRLEIDPSTREIFMSTRCVFYDNVNGEYGDPVTIPMPLEIGRLLTAADRGPKVMFVQKSTAKTVTLKQRHVEVPIPEDEQEEGGPTTKTKVEEYWVLLEDESIEVPTEDVTTLYRYLMNILINESVNVRELIEFFILDEVKLGTYDAVGR